MVNPLTRPEKDGSSSLSRESEDLLRLKQDGDGSVVGRGS